MTSDTFPRASRFATMMSEAGVYVWGDETDEPDPSVGFDGMIDYAKLERILRAVGDAEQEGDRQ